MAASVNRRTRFRYRRSGLSSMLPDDTDFDTVSFPSSGSCSSSMTHGVTGVAVPDSTSLRPLSPLCSLALGAGSPRRKCSSSASVPLSLTGVDSFENGDRCSWPLMRVLAPAAAPPLASGGGGGSRS